jgi:hypothetical protein
MDSILLDIFGRKDLFFWPEEQAFGFIGVFDWYSYWGSLKDFGVLTVCPKKISIAKPKARARGIGCVWSA